MGSEGFVQRFLKPCAVAALMTVVAACGGGGDGAPPPPRVQPASLAISGLPSAAMLPGQSALLAAVMTYSNGTTADVTASAAWGSTDNSVVTVSALGMIQAVAPGVAEVVSSTQGLSARGNVTVARTGPPLALFAGNLGGPGNADGPGADANFRYPSGVATDSAGNVYVADTSNNAIRKITSAGVVSTLAGKAGPWGSADGAGAEARFASPKSVATDELGNVYVADQYNFTVRKITPAGEVSTLAGTARSAGSADGTGAEARFFDPRGVATDIAGNVYVADAYNSTIRKITPAGAVSTLAGTAESRGSADGVGADARFSSPIGIATDIVGNVYVADAVNCTIRKISPAGAVSTLAGAAGNGGSSDGIGAGARFDHPASVATDSAGNVYVADTQNKTIRKITAEGVVGTLAGQARLSGSTNGTGAQARFADPEGVATDRLGNVYVADTWNHLIRRINPAGVVSTLAGSMPMSGSADGIGAEAGFLKPMGAATDSFGNVYVADYGNSTIRKITPAGLVSTLAGTAGLRGRVDGIGADARFAEPSGIATDRAGHVYVVDSANNIVRRISPAGAVSTLAGTGEVGSADGDAASATFSFCPPGYTSHRSPTVDCRSAGVAVDEAGNVFLADTYSRTIRRISAAGIVSTVAGQAGSRGREDGVGAEARFWEPRGIAVDSVGNVYVADAGLSMNFFGELPGSHTIRKIDPAGRVTTLAGRAGSPGSADGIGTDALFSNPRGVAVDSAGNVYVADGVNNAIRKVSPAGVVTTVVGVAGFTGFVPGALPGVLETPWAVALSGTTLYITLRNGVAVVTNVP